MRVRGARERQKLGGRPSCALTAEQISWTDMLPINPVPHYDPGNHLELMHLWFAIIPPARKGLIVNRLEAEHRYRCQNYFYRSFASSDCC
jgi:hypothetical protein